MSREPCLPSTTLLDSSIALDAFTSTTFNSVDINATGGDAFSTTDDAAAATVSGAAVEAGKMTLGSSLLTVEGATATVELTTTGAGARAIGGAAITNHRKYVSDSTKKRDDVEYIPYPRRLDPWGRQLVLLLQRQVL